MSKTKSKTSKSAKNKVNPKFQENFDKAEALTVEKVIAAAKKKGKSMTEEKAKEAIKGARYRAKKELEANKKYGLGSGFTKDGEDAECNIIPGSYRMKVYKNEETGKETKKHVVDIDCRVNPGDKRTVATSDLHQVRGLGPKAAEEARKERNRGRRGSRKSAEDHIGMAEELDDILG